MPYNGSDGTYTLSDTIAPSTLADATELQAILDDIATALTAAVAKSGESTISGSLKGFAGTVSLPGYSFSTDLDSGMYRIGANNIGLAVNGAKVVDIGTAGITIVGTLGFSGDFAINTNKFNVTAASGNTAIAGTLGVVGDVAVNTNKFTVAASSGNTVVAGTLGVTGVATFTAAISGATAAGAMLASQAEMETGTATDKIVTPGRQHNHVSAAKVWARYDSAGTASASYNLTSVTDNGVGNLSPVWGTDFSGAAYCLQATIEAAHAATAATTFIAQIISISATGANIVSVRLSDFTQVDGGFYHVVGYGDQ